LLKKKPSKPLGAREELEKHNEGERTHFLSHHKRKKEKALLPKE